MKFSTYSLIVVMMSSITINHYFQSRHASGLRDGVNFTVARRKRPASVLVSITPHRLTILRNKLTSCMLYTDGRNTYWYDACYVRARHAIAFKFDMTMVIEADNFC